MSTPLRILLKGVILALLISLAFPLFPDLGSLSAYNLIFPGRARLPFGENPAQAYNLSLYNLDAMFAAHEISQPKVTDEYRVVLIGDSSVWGTLLTPDETLAGQLNRKKLIYCGKNAHFYNLGYPTISLTKDLLLMDYAQRYEPDAFIWLTTLEAFPREKQLASPLVANNAPAIRSLIERYDLSFDPHDPALVETNYWSQTLFAQRRALADLLRLQLYGVMWAATGVDQIYPETYTAPQVDFEVDDDAFHDLQSPLDENQLAYEILSAGIVHSSVPVLLINEPMLISPGINSQVRYNFFYPRWAYDQYRSQLTHTAATSGWRYLDVWNIVEHREFTNSAIHLTPAGTAVLATQIEEALQVPCEE